METRQALEVTRFDTLDIQNKVNTVHARVNFTIALALILIALVTSSYGALALVMWKLLEALLESGGN